MVHQPVDGQRSLTNQTSSEFSFHDSDNIATSLPVGSSVLRKLKKRPRPRVTDLDSSFTEVSSRDSSQGNGIHFRERERKMFYLTTHPTHFIYGYMASDIWLRTILIVRKETRCHHMGYSYRLTARVLLFAPSHRQDSTYHGLCYTSRGALAGTRNSSMGPPHEGSIRRPIVSWANALPLSYVPFPDTFKVQTYKWV